MVLERLVVLVLERLVVLVVLVVLLLLANKTVLAESEKRDWEEVKRDIGHISSHEEYFHKSLVMFKNPNMEIYPNEYFYLQQSTEEEIAGWSIVHVDGNVHHDIYLEEHSELVITGNVYDGARIFSMGISKIYIGGDMNGQIESSSSTSIFVRGSLNGNILTGEPSTRLHVTKNLTGTIKPTKNSGSLLFLTVLGHADKKQAEVLKQGNYIKIVASFGTSNLSRGIHHLGRQNSYLTVR